MTENIKQQEFPTTKVSWIHAGPFADNVQNDADQAPEPGRGHGTCMASVALGTRDGVAKNADLTVVKADIFTSGPKVPDANAIAPERWLDALGQVYDDIEKNTLNGKAVVSMSWGFNKRQDSTYDNCLKNAYTAILNGIISADVTPVVAAGQASGFPPPPTSDIQTYPALLANLGSGGINELVVVTSVDKDGDYENGAWYAPNTIAALGDEAQCANSAGGTAADYHDEPGTSPGKSALSRCPLTFHCLF